MPEMLYNFEERRSEKRVPPEIPLTAVLYHQNADLDLKVIDLSEHGAKLHVAQTGIPCPLEMGAAADIRISTPFDIDIPVRIDVAWTSRFPEGYLIGIRFTRDNSENIMQKIYDFIPRENSAPAG
jgi:hypothetical protein